MNYDYYTRLTIEIEDSGCEEFDSLSPHTIRISSDMVDTSIHGWFAVFEKVLRLQGFHDDNIARGACQLAFNEARPTEFMRKVADEYDLKLLEDIVEQDAVAEQPVPVVVTDSSSCNV